ncbi:ABC transporter ATP-binding protein [Schaalia sp. 19OD2882]|uniref:ABC transporter ATP-binding protein n=1 Tax=Schaalia sp. 19OD2882 TaxID=2794089 RepID=UPI001C1E99E5|nr:ABC transporter ATP-binding protein [Schaalia sp. 19OD2882]QWW19751.1 ABC transporter ATP-binding protein [Schaalia sp. 19OD2882]
MSYVELAGITRSVVLPDGSDLHILRGVDLTVDAGERVSIVGRSGTGKSTLLNIIGMLDKPNSGSYTINGRDAVRLGEGRRARLRGDTFGFVFQQFNIFAARTALENVEVPLLYSMGTMFWRRRELCAEMLERVGLGDRLDSYPGQMSGGEQQRIAIARALVRQPKVILADEPTGALDPNTGSVIMELLETVAQENNAALITITHDLNVAARADRVMQLGEGRLHLLSDVSSLLHFSGGAAETSDGVLPGPPPAPVVDRGPGQGAGADEGGAASPDGQGQGPAAPSGRVAITPPKTGPHEGAADDPHTTVPRSSGRANHGGAQ